MAMVETITRTESPARTLGNAYRYYVVGIIWLVMLLRFVDWQIVGVLLESLRREFKVSDTQLGFLSGTAFALFYTVLGLPIAWLADRYSRRNIIAACLAMWSGMTALFGMAGSFTGLLLARVGVSIGEAGGQPPSHSLISDYFPARQRSTVFAFLACAAPAGVFAGYLIGGAINAWLGWRATVMVIGLFGLAVAALLFLTVREPVRGGIDGRTGVSAASVKETARYLWSKRSYRHFVSGASIATLGAVGSGVWIISFFVRVHGMTPLQASTWIACVYGIGGVIGALTGGAMADRLAKSRSDARWHGWIPAIAMIAIVPFCIFVYLWPNPITALLVHTGNTFLLHAWMGPCYGTVQTIAGPSRRAMASAVNVFAVNLIALGLGPLLVGAMSDYFNATFGETALRYSILTLVLVTFPWAALHFLLAARTLRQDLASERSSG